MTKIKPGLGRGLGALINPKVSENNEEPIAVQPQEIQVDDGISINILAQIKSDAIKPNPYQPRNTFDEKAQEELKKSILENGLIQPITVRRVSAGSYELISGERRLRACKEIGMKIVPAYILHIDSKEAMLALSLIENLQREDLNPIEIASTYKRLMDECALSHDDIAQKVGKERSTITNSLRLLKLPDEIQQELIQKKISMGHARAIINVPSKIIQLEILKKIKNNNLSVRKTESLVQKLLTTKTGITRRKKTNLDKSEEISLRDIEDKLRHILGTKISCKQKKDGSGEIKIEYYSLDELDRLFELFDIIEKYN